MPISALSIAQHPSTTVRFGRMEPRRPRYLLPEDDDDEEDIFQFGPRRLDPEQGPEQNPAAAQGARILVMDPRLVIALMEAMAHQVLEDRPPEPEEPDNGPIQRPEEPAHRPPTPIPQHRRNQAALLENPFALMFMEDAIEEAIERFFDDDEEDEIADRPIEPPRSADRHQPAEDPAPLSRNSSTDSLFGLFGPEESQDEAQEETGWRAWLPSCRIL